jgi:prolyl 4-hydroxylase
VASMTRLASQLLSGTDGALDPWRGAELLSRAAQNGGAEAAALMAVLSGAGVCCKQSWDESLAYLQVAAERGSASAQDQLIVLCADRDLAERVAAMANRGTTVWRQLRNTVDIPDWLNPPPRQVIADSPRIRKIDRFLSRTVCRWLIERARGRMTRARIYSPKGGGPTIASSRTNTEADFNIVQADVVLTLVRARIAAATGLPPAVMELTKVLHYSIGERFSSHFDFIDPTVPDFADELAVRGQRLATFLTYLNDDYEGGETEFSRVGLRHRGTTGSALYFANVDVRGEPDTLTLHAGLAPTSGEKWLLSQWLRDRAPGTTQPCVSTQQKNSGAESPEHAH